MKREPILALHREFIEWFLRTRELKYEPARRLLEYLLENRELLQRVEFVEDIVSFQNAALISAKDAPTHPFLFRWRGRVRYDVDEALADLQSTLPVRFRLWLSFDPGAGKPAQPSAEELMGLIDDALDRGDREAFKRLARAFRDSKSSKSGVQ